VNKLEIAFVRSVVVAGGQYSLNVKH